MLNNKNDVRSEMEKNGGDLGCVIKENVRNARGGLSIVRVFYLYLI